MLISQTMAQQKVLFYNKPFYKQTICKHKTKLHKKSLGKQTLKLKLQTMQKS